MLSRPGRRRGAWPRDRCDGIARLDDEVRRGVCNARTGANVSLLTWPAQTRSHRASSTCWRVVVAPGDDAL
ncbi:Uncharacterised protein [Mycobacteroides abscessus subsp. abscessus]|nr:Uncharacterised protein [Mycobacteroides abscessus subsp. abscessus]